MAKSLNMLFASTCNHVLEKSSIIRGERDVKSCLLEASIPLMSELPSNGGDDAFYRMTILLDGRLPQMSGPPYLASCGNACIFYRYRKGMDRCARLWAHPDAAPRHVLFLVLLPDSQHHAPASGKQSQPLAAE